MSGWWKGKAIGDVASVYGTAAGRGNTTKSVKKIIYGGFHWSTILLAIIKIWSILRTVKSIGDYGMRR